ncbi:MAG TPA: hypothetical protein VIQ05_07055 [Tardiphaga sp.]
MQLRFSRDGHDPRHIDLVAVIALLITVFGAVCYLSGPSFVQTSTTASFIEASQSARW